MTQRFKDNFISNDFSAWDGVFGSPSVVCSPGNFEICPASAQMPPSNYAYATISANPTAYFRAYVYLDALPLDNTADQELLSVWSSSSNYRTGVLSVKTTGRFYISWHSNGYWYNSSDSASTLSAGQWYCLEFYTAIGTNGATKVYLNGVEETVCSQSGIDNSDRWVGTLGIDIGGLGGLTGSVVTTYYTDVIVADQYIGPDNLAVNNLTVYGNATIGDSVSANSLSTTGNATIDGNLTINGISMLKNDVECYGFYGSSSDPAKGTGGGAIMMGHGFTAPTDNPQFNLTDTVGGGSGAHAHVGAIDSHGGIARVDITNQGSNYYFADVQPPSTGWGARLAAVITGPITQIVRSNPGFNYSATDQLHISGGSGASASFTMDSKGSLTNVTVLSQGTGYSLGNTQFNMTKSDGYTPSDGSNLVLWPVINGSVSSINIAHNGAGAGYNVGDNVIITNDPHYTLHLQQISNAQGDMSPAHLDLGNLTVHGDFTVDGGANFSQDFLAALFAAASAGTSLSAGIANIIDQGVLQVIDNILGIKPTAAPTLSALTLTGSLVAGGSFSQTGGLSINTGGDILFYSNNSPNNCHFKVASNGTNAFNPIWDITGNKSVLYVQRNIDGTDLLQTGSTILNDGYGNMTGIQNLFANAYTINGSLWGSLYGNTVTNNPAFSGTAYVWELAGTGLIIDGCLNVNAISMNNGTLVLDNHSTGNGILQYGMGNYQGMRLAQTTNGYDQNHPSVLSLQTYTDAGHSGTFTWQLGALDLSLLFVDHINSASGGGIWMFDHVYPNGAGGKNIGSSTYYFNGIYYKTLNDMGCPAWMDAKQASEILKNIKASPTKKSIHTFQQTEMNSFDMDTLPQDFRVENDGIKFDLFVYTMFHALRNALGDVELLKNEISTLRSQIEVLTTKGGASS